MVRIRLRRIGSKGQPSYRIVAIDKESPRDGRFLEILGFYNPRTNPSTVQLKEDRIYDWISKGAQPSESVEQVFRMAGLRERFERFKQGEPVETLLAEAASAEQSRNLSQTTQPEGPSKKAKKAG
jgi:small subunit ribosomal protein S16